MPACVYTFRKPARRNARLISTGRLASVMPYSDSTTIWSPRIRQ